MYHIWHHFKKNTKRLFNAAFGWTVWILNRFYWSKMNKTFASMFYHISDSNGTHVTVTKVLGRIFLFIVGEESGKDPDGFFLLMFQDVINLNIVPAMTRNLIMIDLPVCFQCIYFDVRFLCQRGWFVKCLSYWGYFAICFAN